MPRQASKAASAERGRRQSVAASGFINWQLVGGAPEAGVPRGFV
jgi:hypothetical protein